MSMPIQLNGSDTTGNETSDVRCTRVEDFDNGHMDKTEPHHGRQANRIFAGLVSSSLFFQCVLPVESHG